jgi:hypothetical protein
VVKMHAITKPTTGIPSEFFLRDCACELLGPLKVILGSFDVWGSPAGGSDAKSAERQIPSGSERPGLCSDFVDLSERPAYPVEADYRKAGERESLAFAVRRVASLDRSGES